MVASRFQEQGTAMRTSARLLFAVAVAVAALSGCESLDIRNETESHRESRYREEAQAAVCESSILKRGIRSKEDAQAWLSRCAQVSTPKLVEEVRSTYDHYAIYECRQKALKAQTIYEIDKAKSLCIHIISDQEISDLLERRNEYQNRALAEELDGIGLEASSSKYRDFLDRHKQIDPANPVMEKAANLLTTRQATEQILDEQRQRKERIDAYNNAVRRQKNVIAFCKDIISKAELSLIKEQQAGQISGYVNSHRMNMLGRAIVECNDQIKTSESTLSELEKNPRRFYSSAPQPPSAQQQSRRVTVK